MPAQLQADAMQRACMRGMLLGHTAISLMYSLRHMVRFAASIKPLAAAGIAQKGFLGECAKVPHSYGEGHTCHNEGDAQRSVLGRPSPAEQAASAVAFTGVALLAWIWARLEGSRRSRPSTTYSRACPKRPESADVTMPAQA